MNPAQLQRLKEFNLGEMHHVPQDAQWPIHRSEAPVILICGGEGSGKSQSTSAEIAARYGRWKSVLFVCYKAESARNEGDYLFHLLNTIGAVPPQGYHTPKGGGITLTTRDGAMVTSVSTHAEGERAVTGTGKSYDIIAMLEAGKQSYAVLLACVVRASRTGGLLLLSGTIEKSEPWFPDLVTRLQKENELGAEVITMPTWENRVLYPLGRHDPKIIALETELSSVPGLFMERLAAQPSPQVGLIFKEFSYITHVFDWVQYDPSIQVEVAVDPGYSGSHYSVNFIQKHPRAYTRQYHPSLPEASLTDIWVIGDLFLDHAVHEEVIQECKKLPWWDHVTGGVGDIIMKSHPMADRAPIEVWSDKANIFLRGQAVGISDGIDRHHTFLRDPKTGSPRLFFHSKHQGLKEYRLWKRKEIGENLYGDPDMKNCDCMKALQYWLIDQFGRVERAFTSQAIPTGDRVTLEGSTQYLPGVAGVQFSPPSPVTPAGGTGSRQSYTVVPRGPRVNVGGLTQGRPPERII